MATVDLSVYAADAEQGSKYEVKDPGGDPLYQDEAGKIPVTITLAGTESALWRKAEDVVYNRRLKSSNPRQNFAAKTAEEQRQDAAYLLASVTLAWDGIVFKGEKLECTRDNAKMIYLALPFLREQVDAFLGDKRNFIKASSISS